MENPTRALSGLLTPEIMVQVVHYNGLHPSINPREQTTIWMMICSPIIVLEDLKVFYREGLAKLCPPGNVPREYESLQVGLSPGEPGTHGHYLLFGLSTLSGPHMRLRDVLLFQHDFL